MNILIGTHRLAPKHTPSSFQVIHFFLILIREGKQNFCFTMKRQKSTEEQKWQLQRSYLSKECSMSPGQSRSLHNNTAGEPVFELLLRVSCFRTLQTTNRISSCNIVLLPWHSGLVRSTSAVGGGEWLWVQVPSMVVGTPCRGP